MSRQFLGVRRVAVASLASAAALAAVAPAAHAAQSSTLTFKCKYSLVGTNPVTIKTTVDLPDTWPVDTPTPPIGVVADLALEGLSPGLALVEAPSAFSGTVTVGGSVTPPGGAPSPFKLPIPFGNAKVPSSDPTGNVNIGGSASIPPLTFPNPGVASVALDSLTMNLAWLDPETGGPIILPPVAKDIDGNSVKDSDGKAETVDVYCKLDPPTQNTTVAQVTILAPIFDDVEAPTNPVLTGVRGATSVDLSWSASADNIGVTGYEVFNGTTKIANLPAATTTYTATGLAPYGPYAFKVVALDAAGNRSSGSNVFLPLPVPLPPPTIHYGYSLAGSTALKTLTKGTLPLKGSIDAQLTLSTGAYTADLVLNQTQGQLTALGFLPVTAKIGFVPSGKTTGTLADGVLTSNSKVRIKVQEVKLFGAIPLAGGNSCQTKSLSDINLKSTDAEFAPTVGGTLAGTYAISDLNGCGALNGLVSPLTAGKGNTISLKLTPKP